MIKGASQEKPNQGTLARPKKYFNSVTLAN
jgi:hypothetical protein